MTNQRPIKLTNEQKLVNLRSEYEANIQLWVHDDNLRQQRNGTFLNMNAILLVALGTLITISPSLLNLAVIASLISVFGLPICMMWYQIQSRNAEYIRFRRFQLRYIEVQLQNVTTISNQWKALNEYQTLSFEGLDDKFSIKRPAKLSATKIEGRLPLMLVGLWFVIFIAGGVLTVLLWLGLIT
jgi:hypothetical protein